MTATKDMSRQTSQHRLSVGATPSSLPACQPYNRTHSTSLGAGRISRRKSSSFAPGNAAAIEAAVENGVADGSVAINRRNSKATISALAESSETPMPNSLPPQPSIPGRHGSTAGVLTNGPSLSSFPAVDKSKAKRRASDGTALTKKEKAATGELKCDHCGKAYKHGSCLNKHLWEHTPQWQYTSKLLISKHQQVQLLEAASVLVAMNGDGTPAIDSDSSSPAASGSSDLRDDDPSSAETSPPPQSEHAYRDPNTKRYSNSSSAYSRSYQSAFSESAPSASGFGSHYRQWSSSSNRPGTANTSIAESYPEEDPADLAAAVGLLSCSYGTPKSVPTALATDIPPVPPLPAKYQDASAPGPSSRMPYPDDVDMDEDMSDEDAHAASRHHQHDDDEGIFGKMD
ncbi:hypothetical protein Q7P37_004643 [Cladosporium fusiforme]